MIAAVAEGAASFPSFRPHPEVDLILLVAGVGYWWVTSRKFEATRKQKRLFFGGLIALWLFASWPVHDVGEELLYSVHMTQHTVFSYVAPPLMLLGCPRDLIRWLVKNPVLGFCCRTFARPLIAVVLFNINNIVLHIPAVVNVATVNGPIHFLVHLQLFLVALCLWFPVVNSVPELPRLRHAPKILYLMASSFIPVIPVAFLALAPTALYSHYAAAPRLFDLDAVGDQQAAAGAMWLVSSFWMTGTILIVFLDWWRTSQRDPATATYPKHLRRAAGAAR